MPDNTQNNKRIAMNTIFLYIKMMVVMLIGFYTSRVLLQNLGVEDFGIYGVVGGIVTMFASLKTMFTTATQRFLNIEIGHGDKKELNKIFNISILVNSVLALLFLIVVEIGGLWLLETKLNIALERMVAAHWVFQFSVISAVISIFNSLYDADIIAREKMNVFAAVSIFDAVSKLGIVIALPYLDGDRLIIYGLLMLAIVIINLLINVIYCRLKFEESKLHRYSYGEIKTKFMEMFSFSGWAFFGNVVFALVNEGINVLLNIFGSVVANAARTIAYQVQGALSRVVTNVYTAVKPQSIQAYARNDMERYYKLMFTGAKIVGYMYVMMAIPLYFSLEEILRMWLKTVPEYAVSFLTAIFIYQYVRVLHESVGSFFVTIGRLKEYQITEFVVQGSALPLSYISLKYFSMPLYGVFLVMAVVEVTNQVAIMILAKRIGNFDVQRYFATVLVPYGTMTIICLLVVFPLKRFLFTCTLLPPTVNTFVLIVLAVMAELILMYYFGLRKDERNLFFKMIQRKK